MTHRWCEKVLDYHANMCVFDSNVHFTERKGRENCEQSKNIFKCIYIILTNYGRFSFIP